MPSNADRRPKITAQRSSELHHTQLHFQDPHLYPGSNPYSLPPREDCLSYNHPTNRNRSNPNPTTNTRSTARAPAPLQTRPSSPSDAALFWSFVSRQIQKRKAKSLAKNAKPTTSSTARNPTPRPLPNPILHPSSTRPAPPPSPKQQPPSLFQSYRRQRKEKQTRARKALISAPVQGGVAVVRTDSGKEYSFPEPRAEGGVVRVVRGRGGTRRGRKSVVMPKGSGTRVAGLRQVEVHTVRRMPSQAGVVGLGIDLGDGEVGPTRAKATRTTRWGDFLGKSSEERERERRNADKPSAPTAKAVGNAYGGSRDGRCRICHEPMPKESRSSGVCVRCLAEYSFPYTTPFPLVDPEALSPVSDMTHSRHYTNSTLFTDFDSPIFPLSTTLEHHLSPFNSQTPLLPTSTSPRTTRRGAVSAPSPTSTPRSRFPPAPPPIPYEDEYTSRKLHGLAGRRSGSGKEKGREEKRRSSFYSFWDDVLAGSRASLAARRGYDGL